MSSFKGKTHTQKLQILIDQGYQHLKYKRWRNCPAPIPAGYTFKKGVEEAVFFEGTVDNYKAEKKHLPVYLLHCHRTGSRILWNEEDDNCCQVRLVDVPKFKRNKPYKLRGDLRVAFNIMFNHQNNSWAWARATPPPNEPSSGPNDWRVQRCFFAKDDFSGVKNYRTKLFKYWITQIPNSFPADHIHKTEEDDKIYIYSREMVRGLGINAVHHLERSIKGITRWSFLDNFDD